MRIQLLEGLEAIARQRLRLGVDAQEFLNNHTGDVVYVDHESKKVVGTSWVVTIKCRPIKDSDGNLIGYRPFAVSSTGQECPVEDIAKLTNSAVLAEYVSKLATFVPKELEGNKKPKPF